MPRLTMTIRHGLGREAARQRLDAGLGHALGQIKAYASNAAFAWNGDDLSFRVTALGATASGTAAVGDSAIAIDANLPLVLLPFTPMIRSYVEGTGQAYFDEAPRR